MVADVAKLLRCARTLQQVDVSTDEDSIAYKMRVGAAACQKPDAADACVPAQKLMSLAAQSECGLYISPKKR